MAPVDGRTERRFFTAGGVNASQDTNGKRRSLDSTAIVRSNTTSHQPTASFRFNLEHSRSITKRTPLIRDAINRDPLRSTWSGWKKNHSIRLSTAFRIPRIIWKWWLIRLLLYTAFNRSLSMIKRSIILFQYFDDLSFNEEERSFYTQNLNRAITTYLHWISKLIIHSDSVSKESRSSGDKNSV